MPKEPKINWEELADQRLTFIDGQKSEGGNGPVSNDKKTPKPEVKNNTPEKKKAKNQTEINSAQEHNEKVMRERAEIKKSVDGALNLVAKALQEKGLSPKDRTRLQWIQKSVEGAKNKIVDGENYSVEVVGDNGNVLARRLEGVPVDDLTSVVKNLEALTQKQVRAIYQTEKGIAGSKKAKEEYDLETVRAGISGDEQKKKMAWFEALSQLPAKDQLKEESYKLVDAWEEADRQKALSEGKDFTGYDADYKKQQLGEALCQRAEKYLKIDDGKLKQELEDRTRRLGKYHNLAKVLIESSVPYFAFHYPKNFSKDGKALNPLEDKQKKEQHLYTEHEANLIAKDAEYKAMLLERFSGQNKLPQDFANMDVVRQNHELARLALEARRILVLPKEVSVPDEILETEPTPVPGPKPIIAPNPEVTPILRSTPEATPAPAPEIKPTPTPVIHKLKNTNEPYDWENGQYEIPKPVKPEMSKDIFLIDISEIAKRMAWTKAEEKLSKEFDHKGGRLGRLVKNAWKGMSENYKRIKYYEEALKEIQTDNNLMSAISGRVSGQDVPNVGTRISSEYLEMLDKVVAEYKNDVVDSQRELGESMNNDPEVQNKFAELLYRYRENKWEGDAYKGLDKRAAVELFVKENIAGNINKKSTAKWTTNDDRLKEAKGLLYASNFYEILESVDANNKAQIDAAVKDVMDKNPEANIETIRDAISKQVEGVRGLNLQLGLKDRDIVNNRPKGILNLYEKAVDWGENHKVLGKILLNPFVIGVAATVATRGVQRAIKWAAVGGAVAAGATGFWVPLGIGALAGGAYRAIKRGKDTEYDTAQELRHQTLGGKGSGILGEKGERSYDSIVMSFKEAMTVVASMENKTTFTEPEKKQLAQIYARLQLERDAIADQSKKLTKVDLFRMEEDQGNRYGSNVSAKADLRIALKKLGIREQDLQAMANNEKAAILNNIKEVNEKQDKFKYKEMAKSFLGGAVMGFAGGILAQEAIHLGGQQAEKLWGGSYFKNQHTSFDKIVDWAKASKVYQSNFGGHSVLAGGAVENIVTGSRDQTSTEWLKGLKGYITGGNVEKIHTQNWYDNPTGETSHIHNENELRFYINKDSAGSFHFKVPVEQGGSWMVHNQEFQEADLEKAFADGRIKMLFIPDGNNIHDAVALDVDPVTNEVVIPKDSNIANLFDPETGRPKGTGFFGLAENTGVRGDGSKNYTWISSERNNGADVDFGNVNITQEFIPDKPVVAPIEYSQALPTVPPQRKVFYRPGENKVEEKKKQKKAEKDAKQKVDKEKKEKELKAKADSHKAGASGSHESGGGGGGGEAEGTKKETGNTTEVKAPEFSGDTLKRYTNQKYAAELFAAYEEHGADAEKINKKAVKFATEGPKAGTRLIKDKPVRKDVAKAVWEMEQALITAKVFSQDQLDEFYGDVVAEETKATATTATATKAPVEAGGPNPVTSETLKTEPIKSTVETGSSEFGSASKALLEKTGRKVHFNLDGELMPDPDKLKVIKTFDEALYALPEDVRTSLLNKFNPAKKGTTLSKGIIIAFETNVSRISFDKNNGLHIPPGANVKDVKEYLEGYYERAQKRLK